MALMPAPIQEGNFPYVWQDWFRQVRDTIQGSTGSIPWSSVGKTGSNLTDLVIRNHDNLQNISGSGTYHLSSTEQATLANSATGTWTPAFTNLTVVLGGGSITYIGRYTRVGNIVFWQVTINTSGGATTASTAGTTYHDLPITATQDDVSTAVNATTKIGLSNGYLDSTNDRNYSATWAATTNTIVLSGKYEV
jgi:hypothetical protein